MISACLRQEKTVIEAFETYTKQTYRNRCVICGPNGPQKLTIPVVRIFGNHTMVKDIGISYAVAWQKIHWRSIETAYNNSPFFLYYRDYFEPFYRRRFNMLLELNTELLNVIFGILGVVKTVEFTSSFEKQPEDLPDNRSLVRQKKDPGGTSFPNTIRHSNLNLVFSPI